jgi:hypothetical protein
MKFRKRRRRVKAACQTLQSPFWPCVVEFGTVQPVLAAETSWTLRRVWRGVVLQPESSHPPASTCLISVLWLDVLSRNEVPFINPSNVVKSWSTSIILLEAARGIDLDTGGSWHGGIYCRYILYIHAQLSDSAETTTFRDFYYCPMNTIHSV